MSLYNESPSGPPPLSAVNPAQGGFSAPSGAPNLPPDEPRRAPTWAWIVIAALAVVSVVFATLYVTKDTADQAAGGGADQSTTNTPSGSDDAAVVTVAPGNSGVPPTERTGTRIASGTYQLPGELAPGLYRVGISWFRYDAKEDLLDSSLTNDGPTLLLIPEDAEPGTVQIIGGAWLADETGPVDPYAYIDGTFLVGVDIEPGTYRITAATRMADVAYGARLDDNLEVIVNDVSTDTETASSVTIEVMPTDFAFDFTGTIEKLD